MPRLVGKQSNNGGYIDLVLILLNVGELIIHKAIASARQAEVLDLLLNSVYTEKPQLSLENLRAPQAGIAAL
jgi:hypothetical protein